LRLKFRVDAFNAFNHANFNIPSTALRSNDITSGNFGQITSQTATADGTTARVLQGALRLEF